MRVWLPASVRASTAIESCSIPASASASACRIIYSCWRTCRRCCNAGLPLLIGVSRKSMFGELLQRDVEQRLAGSLAVATAAVLAGASMLRVHDVAETVDAVKVAVALKASGYAIR